jgi:sulfur carrier protein ThiS
MTAPNYIARPWLSHAATSVGYEVDGKFVQVAECSGLGRLIEEAEQTAAQIVAALNGNVALAASHQRLKEALERIERGKPDCLDHALDITIIERMTRVAREALKDAP